MTLDETRAFLLQGTGTWKLATVRKDDRTHVVPVWFVLDGEDCRLHDAPLGLVPARWERSALRSLAHRNAVSRRASGTAQADRRGRRDEHCGLNRRR